MKHSRITKGVAGLLVAGAAFFTLTAGAEAAFWGVAWAVFKDLAVSVAADVISSAVIVKPKEQDTAALAQKVKELQEQLVVYEQEKSYDSPDDFAAVKTMVQSLQTIVGAMDQRMASFDARLTLVEQEMAAIKRVTQSAAPVSANAGQVGLAVNYVVRPGGRGEFQPLTNGGVMRSGDHYKIIFTPQEDGYIYLFQADSSGKIYRLFPLDRFKNVPLSLANPARAGATYVPAQDQSFRLDEQRGQETFYLLVSRNRDAALEVQYQDVVVAQHRGREAAAQQELVQRIESRGPADVVNDNAAAPVSWQEDGQNFSVLQQRLTGADQCVNTLTFTHE